MVIDFSYADAFRQLMPQGILVLAALVVLGVDGVGMRGRSQGERWLAAVLISVVGVGAAWLWLGHQSGVMEVLGGVIRMDPLARAVQGWLLLLTGLALLASAGGGFSHHAGEYVALVLFGTVGMLVMVATEDLITLFVGFELTSLTLYSLVAYHRRSGRSVEAGLKYFLFGSVAAAVLLFGLSYFYGLSGTTLLRPMAGTLRVQGSEPLLWLGLVLVMAGFGFKVAVVPFHLWAPDVYEGAPAPAAALVASGSKLAGFVVMAKALWLALAGQEGDASWGRMVAGWQPLLAVLAVCSIVLGNLVALAQRDLRRLLAYSAIAHAGYAILAVLGDSGLGMSALVYYMATYGLTLVGAFAVVAVLENAGEGTSLSELAGLGRRAPFLSACLVVFLLSLAGIPPLAGFFGKFFVFAAALTRESSGTGVLWLVVVAIAMSAVSLYYYLKVLKQVYVAGTAREQVPRVPFGAGQIAAGMAAALVILLGCFPEWVVGELRRAWALAGL